MTHMTEKDANQAFDMLVDQLWPEPSLPPLANRTNQDHVALSLDYLGWFLNKSIVSRGDSVSVQWIPLNDGYFYAVTVEWLPGQGRPLTDRAWFYQSIMKRRKARLGITHKEAAAQFRRDYS